LNVNVPNDLAGYSEAAKKEYIQAHAYHRIRGAQGSACDLYARDAAKLVEDGGSRKFPDPAPKKAPAKKKAPAREEG
jgi:hypothetical protein